LLANRVGFDCVYAPGYWMMASYLGLPDVGIATYTEMLERISRLVEVSEAPVIADADTGYGGLVNVRHTVRGYEKAGVTGVQIEDQEFPKKCGHTPGKRVVPLIDMLDRLKVALDTRQDPSLLIVARTDARQGMGMDEVLDRAQAFAEVGADLLFLEGLNSEAEMRRACAELEAPILLNMVEGGVTPIVSAAELSEMGVACAIYPAMCSLAAMAAIRDAMVHLKSAGFSPAPEAEPFEFKDSWSLLGFEDIWEFERRWSRGSETD
jgi:2-methylisocitrate lyase-like PEP mutase family enzyme